LKVPRNGESRSAPTAPAPEKIDSSPSPTKVEDTARTRRIRTLKANAATWEHFRLLGLTSETVRDTLQQLLREAA
jgi:hypothetical protein